MCPAQSVSQEGMNVADDGEKIPWEGRSHHIYEPPLEFRKRVFLARQAQVSHCGA
jgi:hypothetical protein